MYVIAKNKKRAQSCHFTVLQPLKTTTLTKLLSFIQIKTLLCSLQNIFLMVLVERMCPNKTIILSMVILCLFT